MIYFCEKDANGRIVGWGTAGNANMIPTNCVACSKEDIASSKNTAIIPTKSQSPTRADQIEAQVIWTALQTDTLLEG